MTVFHEIWSEHSLIDTVKNKNVSAISLILITFLVPAFNATGYANFSIVKLDRSIKRQPIEIRENADTFLEIDAL